jgi:hypothetical protein
VDGQTSGEYEERLEENLRSLLDRFKSGQYKAPPVRRTYVPKGDGKQQRPIGIPTFEDKVLQRAVTMVLGAVSSPGRRVASGCRNDSAASRGGSRGAGRVPRLRVVPPKAVKHPTTATTATTARASARIGESGLSR